MVTQSIRLGSLETRLLFHLESKEIITLTTRDIAKLLNITLGHANKVAWQLARKKRLLRFRKGFYLFAPMKAGPKGEWSENAFIVLDELMKGKPYYISFWSALNHYGLTEQIPRTVQVLATKRRRPFTFVGVRFQFIQTKKLGEWQEEMIAQHKIKMATREQLMIDCLSHSQRAGGIGEISKALWYAKDELDWKKLQALALKANDAVQRRLGYLSEYWNFPLKISLKPVGWRWLDPSAPKTETGISKKWGLILNVSERELKQWMEH